MSIASKLTVGFLAAACVAVAAEEKEILKIEKPADFMPSKAVTLAENALTLKGNGIFLSKTDIVIDPAVKYRISGEFRTKSGKPAMVWLGFAPYTEKGIRIYPAYVNALKDTQTELAEDAKKGDKVLKVKDASKWDTKFTHGNIAFKTADDYSDLPNFSIRKTVAPNAQKNGDVWEILLKQPISVNYPAGTKVRQHKDDAAFIYTCPRTKSTDQWTRSTGIISGILPMGISTKKFWNGTKKVKILVLTTDGDQKSETEIRNIQLVEIK